MAVPSATKKDWELIKAAFREKFGQAAGTGEEDDFAITQMITALRQGEGQSI